MCVFVKRLDGTLTDEETPEGGADKLTPKTCLAKCHSMQATQGGVGNNKCCTCFTCLFDEHSSTDQTSLLKTALMVPAADPRNLKRSASSGLVRGTNRSIVVQGTVSSFTPPRVLSEPMALHGKVKGHLTAIYTAYVTSWVLCRTIWGCRCAIFHPLQYNKILILIF